MLTFSYMYDGLFSQVESITSLLVGLTSRLARAETEAGVGGQRLTFSYMYDGLFSQVVSIMSLLVGLTNRLAQERLKLGWSREDRG